MVGVDHAGAAPMPDHGWATSPMWRPPGRNHRLRSDQRDRGPGPVGEQDDIGQHRGRLRRAVTNALAEIAATSDIDLKVDVVSNQADFILESRDGLLREGGLGALFAVITIFAFLFSLRSTIVAALSIPLSLLIALVLMQLDGDHDEHHDPGRHGGCGGPRGGRLDRRAREHLPPPGLGEDRLQAVIRGPSEVAAAITSSTLTTVAVFLPLGFAGGLVSQFFLPFALTVTFALLASLVVALTVIPVLAFFLVGAPRGEMDASGEPRRSFWVRVYDPTIRWVLA